MWNSLVFTQKACNIASIPFLSPLPSDHPWNANTQSSNCSRPSTKWSYSTKFKLFSFRWFSTRPNGESRTSSSANTPNAWKTSSAVLLMIRNNSEILIYTCFWSGIRLSSTLTTLMIGLCSSIRQKHGVITSKGSLSDGPSKIMFLRLPKE